MSEKLLLVVNPRSGKCRARSVLLDITDVFTTNGKTVTVYPTCCKEQTISYIEENAPDYSLVVVCGGDGTLNEVINGIIRCGKRVPVGYIPLGSTNDFASSVGIPSDYIRAAEKIAEGTPSPYDLGYMNGYYFTYIACTGAFAETSYLTSQNLKNALGHSAYLISSIKSLSTLRKTGMTITAGDTRITGDYLFAAFTNSKNIGGVINFSQNDIKFDDGLFELLLIKMPKDLIDFSALIRDLLNADLRNRNIDLRKLSCCEIRTDRKIGWSIDGEEGGVSDSVNIEVHPKAIDIII